ncbi:MAG: homoserine dehydrogenase [Clostridia bacterium]|nr:homoserine dehydrogenase [Clostridia bacterium]MBR5278762.1 homoserine dehydrogenase [Clostridia bacterium]
MTNIAILGFGTVGSGVYEVLTRNGANFCPDINIKHILDLRTFPDHPLADRVTADFDKILNDKKVSVVVETMGGTGAAYKFSLAALQAGKHVVTSNKACVDKYGEELERVAAENGVCYLYEASVGGGIPVIAPLKECFAGDKILRIAGILNGTTNYILTHMQTEGKALQDMVKVAQELGYAEADPHADLAGLDSARKISILAGIAHGRYISYESIPYVEGIEEVTLQDIRLAAEMGCVIRLIAKAVLVGEKLSISVAPHVVAATSMLNSVCEAFNAISVTGDCVGEVMFYGAGAGSLPTAAAVVGDIARVVTGSAKPAMPRKACEEGFIIAENDEEKFITLKNGKKYRYFE